MQHSTMQTSSSVELKALRNLSVFPNWVLVATTILRHAHTHPRGEDPWDSVDPRPPKDVLYLVNEAEISKILPSIALPICVLSTSLTITQFNSIKFNRYSFTYKLNRIKLEEDEFKIKH
jgi:hypothetical protein